MKIAVSVPNDLYERADVQAAERGMSRSQLYAEALREYLDNHTPEDDPITARINAVADGIDTGFGMLAGRRLIEGGHWTW